MAEELEFTLEAKEILRKDPRLRSAGHRWLSGLEATLEAAEECDYARTLQEFGLTAKISEDLRYALDMASLERKITSEEQTRLRSEISRLEDSFFDSARDILRKRCRCR